MKVHFLKILSNGYERGDRGTMHYIEKHGVPKNIDECIWYQEHVSRFIFPEGFSYKTPYLPGTYSDSLLLLQLIGASFSVLYDFNLVGGSIEVVVEVDDAGSKVRKTISELDDFQIHGLFEFLSLSSSTYISLRVLKKKKLIL